MNESKKTNGAPKADQRNLRGGRRRAAWLAVVWAGCALSASAAHVIRADGQREEGSDIRVRPNGEVVLTTATGQRLFAVGQYRQAVADRPADYDQAIQLVEAQKYTEAIPLLNGVVGRLRGLYWDELAGALLLKCQIAIGDGLAAVTSYQRLVAVNPKLAADANIQDAYWQALIAAKQFERVTPLLAGVLAGPSKADAVRAQLARGDLYAAQNRLEEAAMDYLRVALLFPEVKSEAEFQATALLKAGETLQKMKDERGAQHCWGELLRLYPRSRAAAAKK